MPTLTDRTIDGREARIVATFPIQDGNTYVIYFVQSRKGGTPFTLIETDSVGHDYSIPLHYSTIKQACKQALTNGGWG